jgi:hypothetical protein
MADHEYAIIAIQFTTMIYLFKGDGRNGLTGLNERNSILKSWIDSLVIM